MFDDRRHGAIDIVFVPGHTAAQTKRFLAGAGRERVCEQHVEEAAMDRILRPVIASEQAARFRIDVVAVESDERPFLRGHPHLVHLVRSNAEIVKLPYGIRLDVDADAERTQFAHGFENEAWNADLVERQRGRKSADTAAGDHHEGLGHTLFLHKARGS